MIRYKEAFNNFLKKNNIFYDYYSALNDPRAISWRGRFGFDTMLQNDPGCYINKAFKWTDFGSFDWYLHSLAWDKVRCSKNISNYYNKDLNKNIRVL